jgi:hypothetical protein
VIDNGSDHSDEALSDIVDIVSLENGEFSLFLFCKWLESSQTALFIAFFYSQMFCV